MGHLPEAFRSYRFYGSVLSSAEEMDLPRTSPDSDRSIFIRVGMEPGLESTKPENSDWFVSERLGDYFVMRWRGVGAFAVREDGREIQMDIDARTPWSVVQSYLLNQVLSTALLRLGCDTLHGVACEFHGEAYLFLGGSGFGKSTLMTRLLQRGGRFISDDLLVFEGAGDELKIHRGLPRMKLYADAAESSGLAFDSIAPLSPYTDKFLCAIPGPLLASRDLIPVNKIFVLDEVAVESVTQEDLSGMDKFLALASNVFNSLDMENSRHAVGLRSIRAWSSKPVVRLRYPRQFSVLDEVIDRVLGTVK